MSRITRFGWFAYAVGAMVIIADQLSKAWVLGPFDLPARGTVDVLPILRLTMVWNHGISFGILNGYGEIVRWMLVAAAVLTSAVLAIWARRSDRILLALAQGVIMGGALGNVIDRVRFGAVTDFIDVTPMHFPWVFNVADSAINIGVALLLWDMLSPAKPSATSGHA